jgi:D-alanyl-D-alanine dipeptidase
MIIPDFDKFSIDQVPARPEPFRLVNAVPIRECGEPLVDLRIENPDMLYGERCLPYVRKSVSDMLHVAVDLVPPGYKIRVHTGLRTHKMQADMYWSNYERMSQEHPNWPKSTVRRMCNRFFAPPDVKAPPGHCTGAAVDINLCTEDGVGLNHSSPLERWKGAPTAARGLSDEAAENRRLLCYVMYSAGFSNCRDEFWHWSYGDSSWAVRLQQPIAIYGLIEAPEGAYPVPEAPKPEAETAEPEATTTVTERAKD